MPSIAVAERRSVPLVVRVAPDLAERVRAAAAAERRTISSFGLLALEQAADRVLALDGRDDAHEATGAEQHDTTRAAA